MSTDAELLDLEVSIRTDLFRFDLLDSSNNKIGVVYPDYGVQIENNSAQAIKRRMSSFHLNPDDVAAIDILSNRIRPMMALENGSEYPLGIFLFAEASQSRFSYGLELEATLVDQSLILAQTLSDTVSFPTNTLVTDAIQNVAAAAGITSVSIDSSATVLGTPQNWVAGKQATTYLAILEQLCALAGFHSPYFTSAGVLRCRTLQDLTTASASLVYADGGRIVSESMLESNDLLQAPNRYKVLDSSATASAVSITYDIPDSAPHSYARRGFRITKYVEAPGVANQDQATVLAQVAATQDPAAWETVHFSGPIDPRHETFDVISYRGVSYLELSWRMQLVAGGYMDHEIKRIYL